MEDHLETGIAWDLIIAGEHFDGTLAEADRKGCCVSIPTHYRPRLRSLGLKEGARVGVEVPLDDRIVHFQTKMLGWLGEPGSRLVVRGPGRVSSQRRRFERLSLLVDGVIHGPSEATVKCLVRDLSTGGVKATVNAEAPAWLNIDCRVDVAFSSSRCGEITRAGAVRRLKVRPKGFEIGIEFLRASTAENRRLAEYILYLADERSRRGVG